MKKLLFGTLFTLLILGSATSAKAQLNFWNGTPCAVKIFGVYTYSNNPCNIGPWCTSPTIMVNPFSMGTLPAGPCPFIFGTANYVKMAIDFGGGLMYGIDNCGSGPVPGLDCQGNARTMQMFSFNNAAVF